METPIQQLGSKAAHSSLRNDLECAAMRIEIVLPTNHG